LLKKKKNTEGERKRKPEKSIVWNGTVTEIQGWHFMVHSRGFGRVSSKNNGSLHIEQAAGRAEGHTGFPGTCRSTGTQGTVYLGFPSQF